VVKIANYEKDIVVRKTPQRILNANMRYRLSHPKEEKARHEKYLSEHPNLHKIYYQKLRLEVLTHYGGNPPKCACCGEREKRFLTIDHINNDGAEHRRKIGMGHHSGCRLYSWIRTHNFPSGFQVLCFNCNCGKRMNNGICPHQGEYLL
jgi:hypothetical protein